MTAAPGGLFLYRPSSVHRPLCFSSRARPRNHGVFPILFPLSSAGRRSHKQHLGGLVPLSRAVGSTTTKSKNDDDRDAGNPSTSSSSESLGITDEWGEKYSEPEVEDPSLLDPTPDANDKDDEWGVSSPASLAPRQEGDEAVNPNASPSSSPGITDEWGEKYSGIESEDPSLLDPTPDANDEDDEWGTSSSASSSQSQDPQLSLEDLKSCLVDSLYATDYGFKASPETKAEILELVNQLESLNPTPSPNQSPGVGLLQGNWILLFTAFSELLPIVALSSVPFLKVNKISQFIDTDNSNIVNATEISSPFASISFSASASFQVCSPSRIQVSFKEGTFEPPVVSSTVDLPESLDVLGQKVNLLTLKRALDPLQNMASNINQAMSGLPPLKVPIPGDKTSSWLLTTYLDRDLRISRGDGGLFVLAKEGSPLLDQLS